MQRCCLLKLFQEGPHQKKNQNSASKLANLIIASTFIIFLSLVENKKIRQESEYERMARLDKRIKWVRARHELANLVMGIIFLVLVSMKKSVFIVDMSKLCLSAFSFHSGSMSLTQCSN